MSDLSNLEAIFFAALEKSSAEGRADFLHKECAGDNALRQRVEKMLAAQASAGSFLESPPSAIALDPGPTAAGLAAERIGSTIGPYKLLEQIGEGGMGLVYMAEQQRPMRRLVALKLIKPGMDSRQVIARFEAEKQALAMMDHPNIARIYDAGVTGQSTKLQASNHKQIQRTKSKAQIAENSPVSDIDPSNLELVCDLGLGACDFASDLNHSEGRPFFVMELVRGIPINEFCDQKRLTVRERLELFIQVCQAVQHAHQKGIIHRDLKPTNVLVTMHDAVAVPKVIDFGIAKALGPQLTEHTLHTGFAQLVGTPLYMSPEQAEMNQLGVDTRSDVYSLGVMLYELLAGTTPFDKETLSKAGLDEMRRMIREDEPPRPSARLSTLEAQALSTISQRRSTDPRRISSALRGELDWIVMKALEKDRNRRYESASAFAADIQRYLSDEPVQACPPSAAYRLRKFVRRNQSRVMFAGLTTVLLAVVAIGSVATYSKRVTTQRQIAQDVSESLAAAKSAIEAGDLPLAEKRVAEAKGRLGDHRSSLTTMVTDVDKFAAELDGRRSDQERFDNFVKLARGAQDKMSYGGDLGGGRVARQALDLYGVITVGDWLARLDQSYLRKEQKRQAKETAYETLVSLADYGVRWSGTFQKESQTPQQSLELLDRVSSFHEPTRAFWFVRRQAHLKLKSDETAQQDDQRFQATPAKTAWDYYLPGHSAGWAGDIDEAIRSYEAALRVQPDHYNSLFFLGLRLAEKKPERMPEAVVYFTACIALRPNLIAYRNRAWCYVQLSRPNEAEADYSAAIAVAANDDERFEAYSNRHGFYSRLGRSAQAQQDLDQQIAIGVVRLQKSKANPESVDRLKMASMHNLSVAFSQSGDLAQALSLGHQTLKLEREKLGPGHPDTLNTMNCVALWYLDAGQPERSVSLAEEALQLAKDKLGPSHPHSLNIANSLSAAYADAAGKDQAIRLREEWLPAQKAKLGPEHPQTLNSMDALALLYKDVGRFDEALALVEESVRVSEAKFGHEQPHTLNSRNNLAAVYLAAGKPELALPLLEGTLDLAKARLEPDHDYMLEAVFRLSAAYRALGKVEEALPLAQQAYTSLKGKRGLEHPITLESVQNLAEAYRAVGKSDEAQALYQATLNEHPNTLGVMTSLGLSLLRQNKSAPAAAPLRECLTASEKHEPDAWTTFNRRSLLGGALAGQARDLKATDPVAANEKLVEAESLLVAGYEGLKSCAEKIPSYAKLRPYEALQRLIELYTAWDKPVEATKWQKELTAAQQSASPDSRSLTPEP